MATEVELLEKVVIELSKEKEVLKVKIEILKSEKDQYWTWYLDSKAEVEKLRKEIDEK